MITAVHISSSEMVINKGDDKKNTLSGLKKNQIITAKVLQLLPRGKALLLVNGQKLSAKTDMLLKPGEEVKLKVLVLKDAIVLKLIGPAQKITDQQISSLVRFLSKKESIPDINKTKMAGVKDLLYDMALKSDKPDKTFLPKLIEKSGLIWEKKLAGILLGNKSFSNLKTGLSTLLEQDVKANLLKEFFKADPAKLATLKTAASFSEAIENFQLLNHKSSDSGRFLLPFPIFSESAFNFGQLLIDTGGKSKNDSRESDGKLIQISFLLKMTHLGPLRADFSILKKEITGRFLLQDEDTLNYVKSMIPDLKKGLANIKYHVRMIECDLAEKEDIQQGSFIESLLRAREDQVLNIVI